MATTANTQNYLSEQLNRIGWIHLTGQTEEQLNDITDSLGEIIFTTDVVVKPESKSMVTSTAGLSFHSDHPKAKYIVWFCHKQTDNGGDTILVDADKAFQQLSLDEQKELHSIYCFEHKIFTLKISIPQPTVCLQCLISPPPHQSQRISLISVFAPPVRCLKFNQHRITPITIGFPTIFLPPFQ
ncbi:MAG: hypothetical protein JWO06_3150 [Bacteroidota bacterium]|nr:hypothetical protein [Bacteroidota bacterium]